MLTNSWVVLQPLGACRSPSQHSRISKLLNSKSLHRTRTQTHIIKAFQIRSGSAPQTSPTTKPHIAVDPTPPQTPVIYYKQQLPWVSIFIVFGLTVSSITSMITAVILFCRPAFKAAEKAAEATEIAAKDMQRTAEELEKTALMFREDIPLTMQDIQRASEEWELVGKQVNFVVASVTRPLAPKPQKPGEEALRSSSTASDWVEQAGTTTASLSKKVAADTSSLANSLWSTVNQFRQQLGWSGLSKEAAEEAKRLVYIGRQQQEARSWIAAWRSRTGGNSKAVAAANTRAIAAQQRQQDEQDLQNVQEMGRILQQQVEVLGGEQTADPEQQEAVEAVLVALERAQRAAEEAAASSSALERAIEQAESTGALSSDEEDEDWEPRGIDEEESDGAGSVERGAQVQQQNGAASTK